MRRFWLALLLLLPGCCSSCGCGAVAPQAGGPTPYARCAAAEAPRARTARIGGASVTLEGRVLSIAGLPVPFRAAVFRGPAPHGDPVLPALDAIEAGGAHLAIALGSLGDDAAAAEAVVGALSRLPMPVLLLGGGRDEPAIVAGALDALTGEAAERVIDVSALHEVRVGPITLVPVAGAPLGRYARSDAACGVGREDLDTLAAALGPGRPDERRILLSWAAPAGIAAALGLEGADAGSAELAELAERIGASQGIHAWPETQAGRVLDGHAIAPALAGPSLGRADGSRAPSGPLVVEIGPEGLRAPGAP